VIHILRSVSRTGLKCLSARRITIGLRLEQCKPTVTANRPFAIQSSIIRSLEYEEALRGLLIVYAFLRHAASRSRNMQDTMGASCDPE